jgi:signal recognition particle subunit SRP54
MLVGLQGSGKTTTAGKLARLFKTDGRSVLLAAADPRRPAAVQQLMTLGESIGVTVHAIPGGQDAVAICREAVDRARSLGYEVVILDTAGRLHIDTDLMDELRRIRDLTRPHETLLVADAMTGQDAVNMASQFHEGVGLTGAILTKAGDAEHEVQLLRRFRRAREALRELLDAAVEQRPPAMEPYPCGRLRRVQHSVKVMYERARPG